ncbi:MAG: MarR family transcriptional regulator [Bacteroidetes bacterium]|nr:MarR family transcriptional regulator [Bacteroidota bacterium]
MKLEEEIQQSLFKSHQQKLAVNLTYTSNWLNSNFSALFKKSDITLQQFNVLRILRGQLPNYCNLKLIKERMLDKMSDASRIVDKLVAKKFIERIACPNDRRNINLKITKTGLTLLKRLDTIDDLTNSLFKNLNNAELERLNNLLDKLRG